MIDPVRTSYMIRAIFKELREANNFSQADIARHLGMSRQGIHDFEQHKKSSLNLNTVCNLCNIYDIELSTLIKLVEKRCKRKSKESSV